MRYGQKYRIAVITVLGLVLALAGGASRLDEDQQTFVRLAAILAIAASLWPLDIAVLRSRPRFIAAVGVLYLLPVLQMIPIQPDIWAALPGHDVYGQIAREAGANTWRPISLTPDLTLNAFLALTPATAAGLCALYLDDRNRLWPAYGIVVAALLSGLLGLVQLTADGDALRLFRETSEASAVGLFANRNHQAAFLACALPLIGMIAGQRLRLGADIRVVLATAVTLLAILLVCLISTGSRMGVLLGVLGLLGAAACYRASGPRLWPSAWSARLGAVGLSAAILAVCGFAFVFSGAFDRLSTTDLDGESRVAALSPMISTADAFMPLGAGFGSFDTAYRRFEPSRLLSTIYLNQAHNEPLQLAIEGGVPALAFLGLFLWAWAVSSARGLRSTRSSVTRAMTIASVTITLILMVASLVDYPLRTPLLSAIFVVACVNIASGSRRGSIVAPGGSIRSGAHPGRAAR